jgi:signal transduction histidine kinase
MNPALPDPANVATAMLGYGLLTALSALLAAVLLGLRLRYPRPHLSTWAGAFAANALGQVASALVLASIVRAAAVPDLARQEPARLVLSVVASCCAWVFAALLVLGAHELDRGQGVPTLARLAIVTGLAALAAALVLGSSEAAPGARMFLRVGLRSAAVSTALAVTAVVILRRRRVRRLGAWMVAAALLGSAVGQASAGLAFVWQHLASSAARSDFYPYRPAIEVVLVALLGLGMVIWLLEDEREAAHRLGIERERAEAERSALVDQLRQSQKMDAVGRLAGGVVHDIKNLLTVVQSWLEPLAEGATPAERHEALEQIRAAQGRAVNLSRQLLSIARVLPVQPSRFDLSEVVRETAGLLPKTLPPGARLEVEAAAPVIVEADPDQLAQVLLNLALNARDAIGPGGRVVVRVGQRRIAAPVRLGPDLAPAGAYAALEVEDDGVGIEAAAQALLFEPFRTTKDRGRGTGLGLSTAYAAVRQAHGFVGVRSAPGRGSAFTVLLPLAEEGGAAAAPPVDAAAPSRSA